VTPLSLRRLRESQRVTASELAQELDRTRQWITAVENGKVPMPPWYVGEVRAALERIAQHREDDRLSFSAKEEAGAEFLV
jgi:transcriptional regulator with XRE-family HTH domain